MARGTSKPVGIELATDGKLNISMDDDLFRISHGAFSAGTAYTVGETITDGLGATGVVVRLETADLRVVYYPVSGPFTNGQTLTGGTSSAVATLSSAAAVAEHRWLLTMQTQERKLPYKGKLGTISLVLTAQAGTAFTAPFTVEVLDTGDLTVALNSENTVYRRTGVPLLGSLPDPWMLRETINVDWRAAGDDGEMSLAILRTGAGDADSDWDFTVQLYGEEQQ